MKKIVLGILAHVDAGKTTLSESLLYCSGRIRRLGRVDNRDAFLDTYELEKERGITIFSKQAVFESEGVRITLLDTPGHVDFSAEMERTLQVLDYAVLVVSGADGVQGHTRTLWRLLTLYRIPVFVFVNKMDQPGADRDQLLAALKEQLGDGCVDFTRPESDSFFEQLALCGEALMEDYLHTGRLETAQIARAVAERRVFPCYFGSALRLDGVGDFLRGLARYTQSPVYPEDFGAKIFKISRDEQGGRLTHMKITGGRLRVKDRLAGPDWEEKADQIRVYSGQKFETAGELGAGEICAVTGLSRTRPGEGLGFETASRPPVLEPVLSYRILFPQGCDPKAMLPGLRQLEEEEPELHLLWDEQLQELRAQIMGEVQTEILRSLIQSRFGVQAAFVEGGIIYKETVVGPVEGVGHFEPLRHYAEVHLLLEPGEPGSGLRFAAACGEDVLGGSWQRLILTHLNEKIHKGVLTGSAITDMKITLVAGRAHSRHTEGGDFREATYRAVRQGLMDAQSVLLEPFYSFRLELPVKSAGKAMTDIGNLCGTCEITHSDGETAVLAGSAPVAGLRSYPKEVAAYTRGLGRLFCTPMGYRPCHNPEEVIARIGYDPERDTENPAGSVFCTHGGGFLVEWFEVKEHMHVESCFQPRTDSPAPAAPVRPPVREEWISPEEIDRILQSAAHANAGRKPDAKRRPPARTDAGSPAAYIGARKTAREEYLLVDGYNVIFAWPELKELTETNMDGAKMKLIDVLCGYRALRNCRIILVFDAYRVAGHREETVELQGIHVVYTKEAQTADQYIERFSHLNRDQYSITVATSDGLQQMIVRGAGCSLLSARELKAEIVRANEKTAQDIRTAGQNSPARLADRLDAEGRQRLEKLMGEND